jgi:hypothetical protein
LDDEGLALGVDLLRELGRDGVMGSRVLDDQTLVTLHALVDGRLLDSPLANVGPLLLTGVVLLRIGRLPPGLPVVGELLEEGSLELGRLRIELALNATNCQDMYLQGAAEAANG